MPIEYRIKAGTEIAELIKWCNRQIELAERRIPLATRQAEKTAAYHEMLAYKATRDFWAAVTVLDDAEIEKPENPFGMFR